ncbi:hypothetical protein MTF65_02690 [Streptomyces sp. APSN-46.1]|nr:hypothetical protein [Streptomyces sp. APSN-46.1]MCJ1676281.1 hypothetical protein [Streptomyces sp. APSN-46.1]
MAPLVGGVAASGSGSWRAAFWVLACATALVLTLACFTVLESLPAEHRQRTGSQTRVKAQGATPEAFAKELSERKALKKQYAELRQYCADIEERLRISAAAINLLALENAAHASHDPQAQVIPLPRTVKGRIRRPGPADR